MKRIKHGIMGVVTFLYALGAVAAQETQFGGAYAALEPEQRRLMTDWVARFNEVTEQSVEAEPFYDDLMRLSTRTTFDAVTHALMMTTLSDDSGTALGTALDLVRTMETVKGKIKGASGDQQFRMYAILTDDAVETLEASREFKRGTDNTVFHRGYPTNYRQQGRVPTIQISIARDGRRADFDVDYRSSSFPAALFNGHLSASNSDVRAGNNDDRHNARWEGFQNWWQGFFGVRLPTDYEDNVANQAVQIPDAPRIGDKTIEKMMLDFLTAWLIEGNIVESMGFISERAYPCVALDRSVDLDLGMAPFVLMMGMKAAHEMLDMPDMPDVLDRPESLEGVVLGVNLGDPVLKLVRQPHHAQFVIYSVPDDVAAEFDCASRMQLVDDSGRAAREYGNYFASTFFVDTPSGKGETVALLWAREDGYWKIVSYESEPMEEDPLADLHVAPTVEVTRIDVHEEFAGAVDDFLTSWFIDNDYDAAFDYMSPRCYSCYNLYRDEGVPEARSDEEAGRLIRESIEQTAETIGKRTNLDSLLTSIEPSHPIVQVMTHSAGETYSLTSLSNAIADLSDCATRARDEFVPDDLPLDYGETFGANFRFQTRSGETPVFRTLWVNENGEWKIISFGVEEP